MQQIRQHHASEWQTLQGPDTRPPKQSPSSTLRWKRLWRFLRRYPIPSGGLLLFLLSAVFWFMGRFDLASLSLLLVGLLGGIPLLWQIVHQVIRGHFGVDLIAILAITGSLLLREYLAGAVIVLMLSGGEALEAYALRRARRSLSALAERAPRIAHIWRGADLIDIPVETVGIGMVVVVKAGEVIPVDGIVHRGETSISEMDLTGEPVPVTVVPGSSVLAGSVNLDELLEVQTSKRSAESKYAQIVHLVEQAQAQKAPIHRLADRYSIIFTPAALLLAGLAWILSRQAVDALAVLVVATPCPLILATPIAIMSGIAIAARQGIIIKSGGAIEALGNVDTTVFDKTGTLTLGTPVVTSIILHAPTSPNAKIPITEQDLLGFAASLEQLSSHILARAIVAEAHARDLPLSPASDFEEVFGKGIRGMITTGDALVEVAVGHRTFMESLGIALPSDLLKARAQLSAEGRMGSYVAVSGQVGGLIVLDDVPRKDLANLVPALKREGIKEVVMLTGDNEVVARRIGHLAGVERVVARCLPEDKVRLVQELQVQGHRVLMIGDGVNDAPALASATVGMALGMQGMTAAASAADTVLLSSDILKVALAVRLGRHVMRVARQGIWIGMGLSLIAMIFAAFGWIIPAAGALLQEGIDILVILNALRVSRFLKE